MADCKVALACVLRGCKLHAADLNWLTDLPKAQAQAKAENKLVLWISPVRTGAAGASNWTRTFFRNRNLPITRKNLVLVQLDFPKQQTAIRRIEKGERRAGKKISISKAFRR